MTTNVRKRHVLRGMRYDRVDLVSEGANGHADILIAKNMDKKPRPRIIRKTMATYECGECGHANDRTAVSKSALCGNCGSADLHYTEVAVTKASTPVKKEPKNDESTNAGQYTYEDEQYDQDNGENGAALGDAVERSVVNKSGWFPVAKGALVTQTGDGSGRSVDDVDNEKLEHQKEGEDSDVGIERMSMTLPVGTRPDKRSGYKKLNTATKVTQKSLFSLVDKKKNILTQEKPGRNSVDYADQGSQEVAESAEQMYRAENHMTPEAEERRESTMSDVNALNKARRRRKTNHEGLDILDNGNEGIYNGRTVRRNGTGTGSKKTTNRQRTAVSPPGNPLDKSRRIVVRKSAPVDDAALPALEALNMGVKLAENMGLILKNNKPDLYETVMEDFVGAMNAAFDTWSSGSAITKSKDADAQADDVAQRVRAIISKAAPDSEDDSDDDDSDDGDSDSSKKNMGGDKMAKKKFYKNISGGRYAGVPVEVAKRLERLDELEELQTVEKFNNMADQVRYVPGFNRERVAKQLRTAFSESEDDGQALFEMLAGASNSQQDSVIYKQLGRSGAGTNSSDPMAAAYAYADANISKSGNGPTREQLIADYIREHGADFYQPAKNLG